MSKIIPVNITTTEQAVTLDATYQFAWLRNMGENDCLLSDHSGIVAGGDNVTLVKAGESGRIATSGRAVYIKTVDGTSTGEIHAQNFSDAPFKSKVKGGGSGSSANIYRTTTALTDGATTNPITVDGKSVTAVSGDFAVYNTQEFLFDGTQWNLLGDRVGLGELAYLDQDDLGELAMKDVDDIHSTLSDTEYEALHDAKKNDGTEYFVYETSEDNRSIVAYDGNGNFLYKMSMYGCNNVGTLALSSKITEPPMITGTDRWGTGSYVFKTTFADGNTYYHNDAFTNGSSINIISNNSARVADAYGTNLFFAISGNRFTIMSAPDSAWVSSLHLDGYNESSFAYGATETGNRKIYRNNKVYGKSENLGALAYKDTASGTAVTTVGTLPSLTYDSTTESFTFSAGTLPTTGTVTVS